MEKSAVISRDGQYRYVLTRQWYPRDNLLMWIMLNPSIADAVIDDPTIRRLIRFTQELRYPGFEVLNLFAYRSPSPKELLNTNDPIGPENDDIIKTYARYAHARGTPIVCAWGANGVLQNRDRHVISLLGDAHLICLGKTAFGQPKHPLYLKADTKFVDFRERTRLPGMEATCPN